MLIEESRLIPNECRVLSALISALQGSKLAPCMMHRQRKIWSSGHNNIIFPSLSSVLSIVDNSSPVNGTWAVWPHLFFHRTENEHDTACLSSTNQNRSFKFWFPLQEKNILFILMGNKYLIRRTILWKRINLPSVISTETQFLVMETEFLALIASNTFGNSNQQANASV